MQDEIRVIPKEIEDVLMDFLKSNSFKIMIVTISIIAALLSVLVLKMGRDNPVEQLAEEVIEMETGVKIDFTPNTGDK